MRWSGICSLVQVHWYRCTGKTRSDLGNAAQRRVRFPGQIAHDAQLRGDRLQHRHRANLVCQAIFCSQQLCEGPDDPLVKASRAAGGQNEALLIVICKRAAQVRGRPKCRQRAASSERLIKAPRQIPGNGSPAVDNLR